MINMLKNLHKEESAQDLIEYALVAPIIALGALVGMGHWLPLSTQSSPKSLVIPVNQQNDDLNLAYLFGRASALPVLWRGLLRKKGMHMRNPDISKNDRGQTIIVIALVMPILALFAGMCVDTGLLYITKAKLSSAVDAACLTGMKNWPRTADRHKPGHRYF